MLNETTKKTGLVLLAAGASTRLGKPKQKLLYKGQTLLQRAIEAGLLADCNPAIVVLGANAEAVLPEVADAAVIVVHNPEWQEGMAASVRYGLTALLAAAPDVANCLFMVCDQPFADAALLHTMLQEMFTSGKGMVACAYNHTIGTPVLFDKKYFPELLALKGQEGAKKLLLRHGQDVATVPFPLGGIDIDTAADYEKLLQSSLNSQNQHL